MLTGALPFAASDPVEWVHCHLARQPAPPCERRTDIPAPLSDIILKLLAKNAEDRYQTAAGVESDLSRCLAEWQAPKQIDSFPLGEHDTPDRLLISEKLYGREREIETLLGAFDHVVKNGTPELVLVSGYPGIGKSSVVNELRKMLVAPRGLFASGKFDQFKRDIPYSTLAQAFQSLIRPLLGKSDAELAGWRDALREALGPNGRLIADLVPELRLIIGEQPPVPELPPQDAQRRFQLVFRRFIDVFARPEHPAAIFLDDLQWLDVATLDLIEALLTQPDVKHLLLIGAYRDNEVDATHPLKSRLDAIKNAGANMEVITLAPLAVEHLGQLIADALRCEPARAAPLAQLVHDKTAGNPFFAIQFLSALVEEGLLNFDHRQSRWSWSVDRINAKGYTDNVVDLMVEKLSRLPTETQAALQELAYIGNVAEIATLRLIRGTSEQAVHADLWEAVRQDLILRQQGTYKFIHDRIHEAAYTLIPADLRAPSHLRIGRMLAAHRPPEKRDEEIFEIVNQLNRGSALITMQEEREQLAELNLIAGKRAKASTAYASALTYFTVGTALLADDCWKRRHELTFALELNRAECEFLTGALAAAENRLQLLSSRAANLVDLAAVTCLQEDLFTTEGRSDRSVEVCLDYLRRVSVGWSAHPTTDELQDEYEQIWQQLGERPIESLLDAPQMNAPVCRATMDVLTAAVAPALFTDQNLYCVIIGRMTNLSLKHGNSDASSYAYALLGSVLGPRFDYYEEGFRFGKLAIDLVEKHGLCRFKARVYMMVGNHVIPWTKPISSGRSLVRGAITAAQEAGDLTYSAYSRTHFVTHLLASGDALGDVQREAQTGLDFARQARFGLVVDRMTGKLRLIQTLRGLTPIFGSFDDAEFDEHRFEMHLKQDARLALAACWYWIRKLQARFFAGDYAAAIAAAASAEQLLWTSPTVFERAEYHFYAALAQAAFCDADRAGESPQHLEALTAHHRQLQQWAANCPQNFESRAALIGAEIARIEGRELEAEHLYEQAMRSAHENGFVHNEALANELAARFYATRGFEKIARAYLQDAVAGYVRWGADGKVRQLEEIYPHLRTEEPARTATSTMETPVEHLDLATVIKVSQAVSGEIVFEKLIDTIMRTAMAQAGAERALLILTRGTAQQVAAEATTTGDTVIVQLRDEAIAEGVLPDSILQYVLRTRESLILDDAAAPSAFAADPYIRQRRARSVLCLPLLNQAKLIGVLYFENNLAPGVFAPTRTAVLKLLASQAAISLENTLLYRDLAEREAKIRRLVDANIIGIFIWDFDGRILEANDAFLRTVGYDREDLVSGRICWTDLTPLELHDRNAQGVEDLKRTGTRPPFEKDYVRKDGSRVPVLIGSATFEEGGNEGVAFVLELTERKRAEEALRASEERFRALIQFSFDVYWESDAQHRFTRQEFAEGLADAPVPGFDLGIGKTRWELPYLEPDEAAWRNHRETLDAHLPYRDFEFARPTPEGGKRYWSVSGLPVFDKAGLFIGYRGLGRQITERKRMEEALRKNEKELREILETIPAMTVTVLPDGSDVFIGPQFSEYSGLSEQDARGSRWRAVIHPDDLDAHVRTWRASLVSGAPIEIETRFRRRDGQYRWFLARAVPLRDQRGNILKWYEVLTDIEDRKRAEEALRESEQRFREYAELASDWLWETDRDHCFTRFSNAWIGWGSAVDFVGRRRWDLAADLEEEPEKWRAHIAALEAHQPFRAFRYRTRRQDGSALYLMLSGKPLFDTRGNFLGYRGVTSDVSAEMRAGQAEQALWEAQMELAHANRIATMGHLTASIAHEISQPVATARNNASAALNFLARSPPDLGEVREALRCILSDTDRARDIIGSIRAHIKKAPPRKDRIDLNEAIHDVIALARSEVAKNGVLVQPRLGKGLSAVQADRVQVQQVLLNLILNAIEAMSSDEGPRELLISTEQSQTDGIVVTVRDLGPGMDPERLDRVFDAFYTTKSSGIGIGLSICRSIIDAHGGRLWAEANKPKGAVFRFTLPVDHSDL